jgi:hypothetical protein
MEVSNRSLRTEISKEYQMKDSNMTPKAESKDSLSHKAGDKLERVGEKVSNAGFDKAGNAISNAGDKLEHMNDKKDSSMPMKK